MVRLITSSILGIFLVLLCYSKSPYPGFSKVKPNIYYKLISFGESKTDAKIGDRVSVNITYKTMEDSIFFQGRRKFQISEPKYKGSINECLTMLAEQEKAIFIIDAQKFFNITLHSPLPRFLSVNEKMKVVAKMLNIQTKEEYRTQKTALHKWAKGGDSYEQFKIKQYLKEHNLDNVKPAESGLYYIQLSPGHGPKVTRGDTVTFHYEGKFLNGKYFDSSKKRKQPMKFVYGNDWQVIEGLEIALGRMQEGEKALVILPSDLAFGAKGSIAGIVPPRTSLIYKITLINIR